LNRDGKETDGPSSRQSQLPPVISSNPTADCRELTGQLISHYRIQAKLGSGGMGEVYRAEDTRLDRSVALKFIAPHLIADEATRRRFEQEAKAVAALDHPNICTIFEIDEAEGRLFLAMALVPGVTVKDRISQGPLKLEEVLDIATQTAAGLEAAHAKGIIHRDIKPANIMLDPQNRVKIMDFGLARLADATVTMSGTIMGTPSYMSPEQARGDTVTGTSDIWSLGVMLYEMAAGRRPFRGDRMETVIHAILTAQPEPVTSIRPGLPPALDAILDKCLAKNPAERYSSAQELLKDLSALQKHPDSGAINLTTPQVGSASSSNRMPFLSLGIASAAVVALGFLGWRTLGPSPSSAPVRTVKFTISPNDLVRGLGTKGPSIDAEISISPDGTRIAYTEATDRQLWVRELDQELPHPVPGAKNVQASFWSPDSSFIGYAEAGSVRPNLMKISVEGGTPALIGKIAGPFRGGNWSSDGTTIVYCDTTGLYTIPAIGGEPTLVLAHDHIEAPSFVDLPDGRRAILYQAVDDLPGHSIYLQVPGEQRHFLALSKSANPAASYNPTGHIVFVDGVEDSVGIWALPISVETLEPAGKPFPIAMHGSSPKLSKTGTLVYSDAPSLRRQLAWADRSGARGEAIGEPVALNTLSLSPDGQRLVVVEVAPQQDLWIYDLKRHTKVPFTSDPAIEVTPSWPAAGEDIVYSVLTKDSGDIFSKPSNGAGGATAIAASPANEVAPDLSSDHRYLAYTVVSPTSKLDLMYRERRPNGSWSDPNVFLSTPAIEAVPRISPDGRFLAYYSDKSGRPEVYIREFPGGANEVQVSGNGGMAPRWRKDGKELFYVEQTTLVAVGVTLSPAFQVGAPQKLFERASFSNNQYGVYDVTSDGKRFVVVDPISDQPLLIHVVHNWFEEFRGKGTP
jgi:eukaryotic-like serine/threonine-protein kinase